MGCLLRALNVWMGLLLGSMIGFIFYLNACLKAEYGHPQASLAEWDAIRAGFPFVLIVSAAAGGSTFHLLGSLMQKVNSRQPRDDVPPIAEPFEK